MKKIFFTAALVAASFTTYAQVGVGTTTPATGTTLHIDGAKDNTSATPTATEAANDVVVTDAGNVGIGTTTPIYTLDAVSTSGQYRFSGPTSAILRLQDNDATKNSDGHQNYIRYVDQNQVMTGSVGFQTSGQAFSISNNNNGADANIILLSNGKRLTLKGDTGNVGIGESSPSEKLHVAGSIKMVDGNQGAGKLMVSDADGKATWTPAATALGTSASKFTNDATNTRVALTNLSDGTTARTAGTEFVVTDAGNVGIGGIPTSGTKIKVFSKQPNSWPLLTESSTTNYAGIYEEAGANAGQLRFYIHDGTKYAINMSAKGNSWINTTDNFGLGNATPTYKLDALLSSSNAFRFLNGTGSLERVQATLDSNGFNMTAMNTSGNGIPFIFTGGSTERMRIAANGNVGIGTETPTYKLSVEDAAHAIIQAKSASNTGQSSVFFGRTASNGAGRITYDHTVSTMAFVVEGSQKAIITTAGNVGIGTATPTSKLHVVGLPVHVDNAAAITAGLTAGAFYHAGDGVLRVVF